MQQGQVPFEDVRPTAQRIARLAHTLFAGYGADVIWREDERLERLSRYEAGDRADLASAVLKDGEAVWLEDFLELEAAKDHPLVSGTHKLRSGLAVPIRAEGEVVGVLCAFDQQPRPRDETLLRRFSDLAELLSETIARVHAVAQRDLAAANLQASLEETARSEERLKLAVRLAKVHVWELDHRRKQLSSDGAPPSAKQPRRSYGEARNNMWVAVDPQDRPAAEAIWDAHLAGGPPMHAIYRMLRADGTSYWVESAAEAVRGPDGRIARVVGAVRNIDREKRTELDLLSATEAAEAASMAKSAFVATMSHEIRTPLNGVIGMAQAMALEELPPFQRQRLEVIRRSGETLLTVLNDVLDLSKIEAGKLDFEDVEFDLDEVAASAYAPFSSIAKDKGLAFSLAIDDDADGTYRGDPVRIRQILYNLISNALKFTEAGSVTVTLRRDATDLVLEVVDTGIGIPAERQASLFNSFVQVDSSTTRRFGGTGLGLAICRRLAELMGGEISLHSSEGDGASFLVRLPLTYMGLRKKKTPAPAPPEPQIDVRPQLRILAAEDNPTNQLVLRTLLAQVGIEPVVVDNGRLAVEAWLHDEWDLILMDAQMPELDGLQATRMIREAEASSGRPRTPIIALTANALSHQVEAYTASGMDGFVAKPIQVTQLFAALQAALRDSNSPVTPVSLAQPPAHALKVE